MMEFFKILTWLLLNVGVPLLAPIALLPLLGASEEYRDDVRKLIRRSLQEGPLFWTVIAMCAAACYEAAGHVAAPGNLEISRSRASWFYRYGYLRSPRSRIRRRMSGLLKYECYTR